MSYTHAHARRGMHEQFNAVPMQRGHDQARTGAQSLALAMRDQALGFPVSDAVDMQSGSGRKGLSSPAKQGAAARICGPVAGTAQVSCFSAESTNRLLRVESYNLTQSYIILRFRPRVWA